VVEHGGGGGSGSRVRVWGLLGDRPPPDIEDVEKGGGQWLVVQRRCHNRRWQAGEAEGTELWKRGGIGWTRSGRRKEESMVHDES
jgi:hypothetical protein